MAAAPAQRPIRMRNSVLPPGCDPGAASVGKLLDPPVGPPNERHRIHEGDVDAGKCGEHDHDQTHVAIQRQPADTAHTDVQVAGDSSEARGHTLRWVISTPAGFRVEPEVYCR